MATIKCGSDGKVLIERNNLVLVSGGEEVKQAVLHALKTFRGEWFLDVTLGVPWFQEILVKNPATAEALLKREILSVPGVLSLDSFVLRSDPATRRTNVVFKFGASDGPVEGSLVL